MRFGAYAAPYLYHSPYQKPDPEMEKQALKNQAQLLKEELDFIEKRIAEIETEAAG
jgi:RNA polymerase-interacting CarD/CdnL/TRCF family regulator